MALEKGKERGLFNEYSVENAEALSFQDEEFDIVFCKEAFHHFPRAIMGLYEMIRVAKHAVILIEPQVWRRVRIAVDPLKLLPRLLKDIIRRRKTDLRSFVSENAYRGGYEGSGNYIYATSYSEVEQIVRGIDLPGFAWKGFVDNHEAGAEFAKAEDNNPIFSRIKSRIREQEESLKSEPVSAYPLAVTVIFKSLPDAGVLAGLSEAGFEVRSDTRNPVINAIQD